MCPSFSSFQADGGQEEGEWEEVLPAVTQTVASLVLEGLGYTPPATDVLIPRGLPLEGLHHGLEVCNHLHQMGWNHRPRSTEIMTEYRAGRGCRLKLRVH
jgi:hypothetical protein